jgi:hypothetical protein
METQTRWRSADGSLKPRAIAARALLAASLAIIGGCSRDPFDDNVAATGAPGFAVVSTDPAANATGVPVNKQIGATFSGNLDCASVSATSFTLVHANGAASGAIDCTGNQALYRPSGTLLPLTEYIATLTRQIRDLSGNTLAADHTWRFTTAAVPDSTPPVVTSTDPVNGASGVPLNKRIAATYSETLDCASVSGNFQVSVSGTPIAGQATCSGAQVMFTPSATLTAASPYAAVLKSAIRDSAGNRMLADHTWFFTTGAGPDQTPPVVTNTDPDDGASLVSRGVTLTATFSEPIVCDPKPQAFLLTGPNGESAKGSVTCSGNQASFNPSERLAALAAYTATLTSAISDLAGNTLAPVSWSFTTGPL